MRRTPILVAHPHLSPLGGSNAVAAWTLQALSPDYAVTLATVRPFDLAAVNRTFGTSLLESQFEARIAPARYLRLVRSLLPRGALFEMNLTVRWARELDRRNPAAVLLATQNEADFGRPGIQYIHFPSWYLPRPQVEMTWIHRVPGLLRLYRSLCFRTSGGTREGLRQNLSLASSAFVAARLREVHGTQAALLPPPVPGEFPAREWNQRRSAVIAVGRFTACKRWGTAVAIVEAVRRHGHDLGFTLIAQPDDRREQRRLEALAASRPWFRILTGLSREQLAEELSLHRYGLHTMEDEHFGIAVAELQRAGCIPFVHASGGPPEIVGNDPRLLFHRPEEAAAKILRAIEDPDTGRQLRSLVESRRECYSTGRFCRAIREVVAEFVRRQADQPVAER